MIEIQTKHPTYSNIYYKFCFKSAHEDSRMMLESSLRDFKKYILEEQKYHEGITVFLSTKPPFNYHINTYISTNNHNLGHLCVNVDINDTDVWYKWLMELKHKYKPYSLPSKLDLLNFLQKEAI